MDLTLSTVEHGLVPVLEVGGELDLATVPRLRDALVRFLGEHAGQPVVVDLGGVLFIDSTGLGVLVGAQRRARAHAGEILLVVPERLTELFTVTRLDAVFPIHATLSQALGEVRGGR
jgi:anti-sigma B factor antagonist